VTGQEDRAAGLLEALSKLHALAGKPSDHLLEAHARLAGMRLSHQSSHNIRNGHGKARWETIEAFVYACLSCAQKQRPRIRVPDEYADMSLWRIRYDYASESTRGRSSGKAADVVRPTFQLPRNLASRVGLLDPRSGVAKFVGRSFELEILTTWCRNQAVGRLRLLTGAGGIGKTRLALRLVKQLEEDGWRCEWVGDGQEARVVAELAAATSSPIFLAVDYAEARVGLDHLLRQAVAHKGTIRVLLLARTAGQWWELLAAGEGAVRDLVSEAESHAIPLREVVSESVSDEQHVRRAVPVFASALGLKAPEPSNIAVVSPGRRSRILELHAAALVSVLDWNAHPQRPPTVQLGDILGALLKHEERFWYGTALARGLMTGVDGLTPALLRQIVAAGCLLGAADEGEALALLARVPGAPATRKVAAWLRELYPPTVQSAEWLGTMEPDRLAERLVVTELAASTDLAKSCLSELAERQARRALILLARAATEDDVAESLLRRLLPFVAQVVEDIHAPLEVLVSIANAIPYPSMVLANAHAVITRKILQCSVAIDHPAEHARWLTVRALTLAQLGRPEEALPEIQRAVAAYRALAKVNPDRYQTDLAASLAGLGIGFSETGRAAEALAATHEAADMYRALTAAIPGKFELDLSATLANLGTRLSEVGRPAEALKVTQEAVIILQTPPEVETERYWSDLAATLTNLGARLAEAQRFEVATAVARHSVALYRKLAAASPDRHRPDLAAALGHLGARTAEQGLPAEALKYTQEAADLLRELVAGSPDRYLPNVAGFLANIGVQLLDMGRLTEALYAEQEALRLYREMTASNPGWYRPSLASTLSRLARILSACQNPVQALEASQEAVKLYRQLADNNPGRYNRDLTTCLADLGTCHAGLGQSSDALAAERSAAKLLQEMAAADPDRYQADHTVSLMIVGARLSQLGEHKEALAVEREAISNYRMLSHKNPDYYRPNLALALMIVGAQLALMNLPVNALRREEEAVNIYRELVSGNPRLYRPNLAASLTAVGFRLSDTGRPAEAFAATHEAVALYQEQAAEDISVSQRMQFPGLDTSRQPIDSAFLEEEPGLPLYSHVRRTLASTRYRELSAHNPGYRPDLALALIGLGSEFSAAGRPAEAVAAAKEAIEIYRELVHGDEWYMPNLALALMILDSQLAVRGHLDEALAAIQEAVDLYRALAGHSPQQYRPNLAICLDVLGSRLAVLGRHKAALEPVREALALAREQAIGGHSETHQGPIGQGMPGADSATQETVRLLRTLCAVNSEYYRPILADSLTELAGSLSSEGNFITALSIQREAVSMYRELASANSIRHRQDLIKALSAEVSILNIIGRDDESSEILAEIRHFNPLT
jgi:Tetratricopeptide repeat